MKLRNKKTGEIKDWEDLWGGGRMSEPSLIDITNDKELMDRVLKKSAEMQEETLKKVGGTKQTPQGGMFEEEE